MEKDTKLKVKDQEVTSDRGSSASPSLEDEDEQHHQLVQEKDQKKASTPSSGHSGRNHPLWVSCNLQRSWIFVFFSFWKY